MELSGQSAKAVDGFVSLDGLPGLLDQHLGAGAVVLGHRRAALFEGLAHLVGHGVELVASVYPLAQAVGVMADLGYPRRDDSGRAFDPAVHEAVSTVSGEGLVPGTVAQVVRPGYGPDDKLLRPAAVVVATRAS